MVKIKGPLFSENASGSVSPCLTFSKRKSGQQVRFQRKQKNKFSEMRSDSRALYRVISVCWFGKTQAQKDVYNNAVAIKNTTMSGWNYFYKLAVASPITYIGLRLFLTFNRIVSGAVLDVSKNFSPVVLMPLYPSNSPTLVDSDLGNFYKCLKFDGVDDYVALGNPLSLQNMTEGSISFWFKRIANNGTYQFILTGPASRLEASFFSNFIYFYINNVGINVSYPTLNVWTHFVGVWSQTGNFMRFYLNTLLKASRTYTGTTGSEVRTIGARTNGLGYNGLLDNMQIYNRPLSLVEIKKLYSKAFI